MASAIARANISGTQAFAGSSSTSTTYVHQTQDPNISVNVRDSHDKRKGNSYRLWDFDVSSDLRSCSALREA